MAYLHCKNVYGISVVVHIFEGVNPTASSEIDFRTGDIALGTRYVNEAYTGTASEGSTDGNITEDFKSIKIKNIQDNTLKLLNRGVSHKSQEFAANDECISQLSIINSSTVDKSSFYLKTVKGSYYNLVDQSDLNTFMDAVANRRATLLSGVSFSGGEAELISRVTAAENTREAMDAIVDSRT